MEKENGISVKSMKPSASRGEHVCMPRPMLTNVKAKELRRKGPRNRRKTIVLRLAQFVRKAKENLLINEERKRRNHAVVTPARTVTSDRARCTRFNESFVPACHICVTNGF